jgi:hypothetical protein
MPRDLPLLRGFSIPRSLVVTSPYAVRFYLHPWDGHISSLQRVDWVTWCVRGVIARSHCGTASLLRDKERLSRISASGPKMKFGTLRTGLTSNQLLHLCREIRSGDLPTFVSCRPSVLMLLGDNKKARVCEESVHFVNYSRLQS